jgi:hypothetical protein
MSFHLCGLIYVFPLVASGFNPALALSFIEDAELLWNDPTQYFDDSVLSEDTILAADRFPLLGQVESSGDLDFSRSEMVESSDDLDFFPLQPGESSEDSDFFPLEPFDSNPWGIESSIPMWREDDEFSMSSLPEEEEEEEVHDGFFEMADCSRADLLPSFDKSRVRRQMCVDPTPHKKGRPPNGVRTRIRPQKTKGGRTIYGYSRLQELRMSSPDVMELDARVSIGSDENKLCYLFSRGLLPYGVCPATDPELQIAQQFLDVPPLGAFFAWDISPFKPSTLMQKSCGSRVELMLTRSSSSERGNNYWCYPPSDLPVYCCRYLDEIDIIPVALACMSIITLDLAHRDYVWNLRHGT